MESRAETASGPRAFLRHASSAAAALPDCDPRCPNRVGTSYFGDVYRESDSASRPPALPRRMVCPVESGTSPTERLSSSPPVRHGPFGHLSTTSRKRWPDTPRPWTSLPVRDMRDRLRLRSAVDAPACCPRRPTVREGVLPFRHRADCTGTPVALRCATKNGTPHT